jgi:ribonuclease HI
MAESSLGDAPRVELFTDGACSGNPGPGGWAYILRHPASGTQREGSGGERLTTNNRMELMAAIEGLRGIKKPSIVDLYSDSQYVINGLNEWVAGWKRQGWTRGKKREPVQNVDLWKVLDDLRTQHTVHLHWVRGHDDHVENERCDKLAVAALQQFKK